jgi:hypothetical protein
MSKTYKDSPAGKDRMLTGRGRQRHISVRAVRREPPDLRKLARALIQLALAEAEAELQASQSTDSPPAAEDADD